MCSTLCAQSPCWRHQLSSDNKPQWQGKEKNSSSRRNRNKITPLSNHIQTTEVTWFCVSNAACPPHTLRQVCEEQAGLEPGTATPGSPLQTTAANAQMTPSAEHPRKQPAHASTGTGPALLHRTASCPAAARNRCKCKLCLHDVTAGGCATPSSHSFPGVRKWDAEGVCTCERGTGHLSNSKTLRSE